MALSLSALPAAHAGEAVTLALPSIEVVETPDGLSVSGMVIGLDRGTVEATLTVARQDTSGSTVSRQAQSLEVMPGSRHVVATIALSVSGGAGLEVGLVLRRADRIIAEAQTRLMPTP